jgi:Sensors of blue-light using FAD
VVNTDPAFLNTQASPTSTSPAVLADAPATKADNALLGQMLICSRVRGKPKAAQLKTLHDLSAQNNRNRGLTGVLLCDDNVFVHWLEGVNEYLDQAWNSIMNDNRHDKMVVFWECRDAPERLFGDWTMGLRNTFVARDLLEMLRRVQRLHSPKALLRAIHYEVFMESLDFLERVSAQSPGTGSRPAMSSAVNHNVLGPARHVLKAMDKANFMPFAVRQEADAKAKAKYNELSSLATDASSMFKNSMPMEHAALFDMAAEGMDDLLTMLDMPLRLALGQELWSRRAELFERPIHWTYDGKLVAVFDHATWRVGLHPELTSVAYEQAILAERLRSANDIPAQFRITTAYALFWDYARSDNSADVKLPSRFLSRRIRLRRQPPVPEMMLQPGQQQLLTLLTKGPERLVDLAQSLGLTPETMIGLLKPFYAARCIEAVAST